jgi:hypothetical protein
VVDITIPYGAVVVLRRVVCDEPVVHVPDRDDLVPLLEDEVTPTHLNPMLLVTHGLFHSFFSPVAASKSLALKRTNVHSNRDE